MDILTSEQILKRLKLITHDNLDNELARRLGVSKQSLYQYKQKTNEDIQIRIISLLIHIIELENNQLKDLQNISNQNE